MTRVVVVGGGFAGFHAARALSGRVPDVEVVLVNPTDYFLYLPLLPEVAGGGLDPRRVAVSLPATLPGVTLRRGTVDRVDVGGRVVGYRDPDGAAHEVDYDRLLLAAGSVTALLPVPGVTDHAHGFRGIGEAVYLRDHLLREVEAADTAGDAGEREARLTVVVVGAGYTGTEVAAQCVRTMTAVVAAHPRLAGHRPRFLLVDTADRVLPGLDPRLSRTAHRVLTGLGVDVRTGTSVAEATATGVRLSTGETVATRTLVWCVGVRPDPLVQALGLRTDHGRLVVDTHLAVPDVEDVWAAGDAAAVPDLTRPGQVTAMTAQHAQRQGVRAAANIAASLGVGRSRAYRHHDLGFIVDLGGAQAAANPLGVPLSGVAAKAVARGYHLLSMPGNRTRTATQWLAEAVLGPEQVQLGLVTGPDVPLDAGTPAT